MGGVIGLAATVAAAAGAVAAIKFLDKRRGDAAELIRRRVRRKGDAPIIDCERDPQTGVYRPKS